MNRRFLYHVAFWIIYMLIYVMLSMGFSAPSDMAYEWHIRFLRYLGAECIELPVKLIATYGLLYFILPRFILKQQVVQAAVWIALGTLVLLLANRLINYYVVFPFMWDEHPPYELVSLRRFLVAFTDILPAIATAAMVKLIRTRIKSQRREQQLVQQKLQSELHFLRAQVNPHFLFNTLNNIYSLARQQSNKTPEVVMRLSKILRYVLYECRNESVAIHEEVKLIEDYIELEKIRYGNRLKISFTKAIHQKNLNIAPFLLLPFVENAFKHGVSETRFGATITVEMEVQNHELIFQIVNTVDSEKPESESGIGLTNVKRQLELLYPKRHHLEVKRENDQYSVLLTLKLSHG